MKTHTIRKLKNKCYPKRAVPTVLWNTVMKDYYGSIQNDTDND